MTQQQDRVVAIQARIRDYFRAGTAVCQRADPFNRRVWRNNPLFLRLFGALNRVNPQTLNIDLNAANV